MSTPSDLPGRAPEQLALIGQSPTERALRESAAWRVAYGASRPTFEELLEALLGRPVAQALLAQYGTIHALAKAPADELLRLRGVGLATVARLKGALALAQQFLLPGDELPVIRAPADAAALLAPRMAHLEQEALYVLLLNTRNRVIGDPVEIYRGSLNTSLVRVGEVFRPAIRANAAAVIISHNHPSQDVSASPEDVSINRAFVEAGKLLDVDVLDHIIIGGLGKFLSMKEKGLGF